MTKKETWEEVQALFANHKVSKKLQQELEDILAPKTSGGSVNPPQEIDGVMHYYCRFHQAYEAEEKMVMSQGKSKGYCKSAISKWNKTNSAIKKLDSDMSLLVSDGKFEEAQEIALKSKSLKEGLNDHNNYDLEQDWLDFTKVPVVE